MEHDAVSDESKPWLSVVAPVFNEEDCLAEFYRRISEAVDALAVPDGLAGAVELIFVDDGSSDGSAAKLADLAASDPRVRVLSMSRNFGHQVAITAGLDHARGAAVVVIDSDLQDPPELIADMVQEWRNGADVVHAVRRERAGESAFKKTTASAFYRMIRRMTDLDIQMDAGDYRLMDRVVVDVMCSMRERHRFVRGLVAWSGFRQVGVAYDRDARFAGSTKYPLRRMWRLAVTAITAFSFLPLQLASVIGFATSLIALICLPVVVILRVAGSPFFGGQTTVLLVVMALGGLQLFFLGVIGEYVGRIVEEVKLRPLYVLDTRPKAAKAER